MTALQLIQGINNVLFVGIFVLVAFAAYRRRTRIAVDTALFFGALAFAVLEAPALQLVGIAPNAITTATATILVMSVPYVMLRLLADFAGVPLVVRAATLGGLITTVILVVTSTPLDPAATLFLIVYFAAVALYAAFGFVRLSQRSSGVTKRRTQAVAAGMGSLGVAVLVAAGSTIAPASAGVFSGATQVLALFAAIAWVLGFAPPAQLRRYWQEPELRAFLERASTLPRLPTTEAILRELERGTGESFGARATIGLYDPDAKALRFDNGHGALPTEVPEGSDFLAARVFTSQTAEYFPDAARAHPQHAAAYRAAAVGPVLVAPITAGDRRIGVLAAFAAFQPVFSTDDLSLAQLLADQAAVVLESRALIDEAARVQAQEEATKLKEDFVSAAAHELKTPLTTLLGQAQILELRFGRDPSLAQHQPAIGRIAREARRLSALVEDLLDASRIEEGKLDVRREPIDVAAVVRAVAERSRPEKERIIVDARERLTGSFDRRRIEQLVDNLVENGIKYSDDESPVEVNAWRSEGDIRISVRDHGIGIPASDVPHVFERFHRAANVDARRYAGIGLGLYICRGIAQKHGGRIWVESTVGEGSTFHVALPVAEEGKLS
ncbi:MAG: ATP-binding protein [Chloroflexota bacterium]|nr:ATP-binding protein [Chloroflexota bacterium]